MTDAKDIASVAGAPGSFAGMAAGRQVPLPAGVQA